MRNLIFIITKQGDETLNQAEEHMLNLYCQRAQLKDGDKVMDLGCGWGSLALYISEVYFFNMMIVIFF